MQGKRMDRLGHLLQMELSQVILTKVKDPRLGFVTITHVDISPDVKSAYVFYSVLGNQKAKDDSHIALNKARGFLQKEVARALVLRFTPKLEFRLDDSLDKTFEIDKVLKKIQNENPKTKESGDDGNG